MATCKDCENYELCVKAGNIGWMNIEQTKESHCGCYKESGCFYGKTTRD
jgi:hypothetical protein